MRAAPPIAIALALALALSRSAAAQPVRIECVDPESHAPAACAHTATAGPPFHQPLAFRVTGPGGRPVVDARVELVPAVGRVNPDSARTDGDGYFSTTWISDGSFGRATVDVHVVSSIVGTGYDSVTIVRAPTAVQYGLSVVESTNYQNWFENAQLPASVYVRLKRFERQQDRDVESFESREDICPRYKVAFGAVGGGRVSPDTAVMWLDGETAACVAYGNWTLGPGAGVKDARAVLVGPNVREGYAVAEPEAYARALPRIIGGPALSRHKGYMTIGTATRSVEVRRKLNDTIALVFDSVFTIPRDTLKEVGDEWRPVAIVGVSAPLVPRWHELSFTAGLDLNSPSSNWYLGISAVRPFGGLTSEALPVDVHALLHFGRDEVVAERDIVDCAGKAECRTSTVTRWHGVAVMVSVELSSLITEVLKRLAP